MKRFDETNAVKVVRSEASTPPRSVVGIGNKGERQIMYDGPTPQSLPRTVAKPDYSEAKIVLAMVSTTGHMQS